MAKSNTIFTTHYLARVIIEAETPLAVGSGNKDIITDALVALDVNGLPYVPGTSLAGVLRHAIDELHPENGTNYTDSWFGFQNSDKGNGSRIIFTDAKLVGKGMKTVDGLCCDAVGDDYLRVFKSLPVRQHVRINDRGVTEKGGKFDEQVVFAGTRFCFEIEMISDGNDYQKFEEALIELGKDSFRIGGGTRSGFGKMRLVSLKTKKLDLTVKEDLDYYMSKSASLAEPFDGQNLDLSLEDNGWIKYELNIKPDDFFLFGSGFGDEEVDMTPVKAAKVVWGADDCSPILKTEYVLIPATSLKGALAHRTAFYYNQINGVYAEDVKADRCTGVQNKAVLDLFGGEVTNSDGSQFLKRGNVLFSDIFAVSLEEKIMNHVSIDRFTGGAVNGALFSEKVSYGGNYSTEILVKDGLEPAVIKAFEAALKDICNGMLPLGGGVNRGHGVFSGTIDKNGKSL